MKNKQFFSLILIGLFALTFLSALPAQTDTVPVPIMHWNFEEGTGLTVEDIVGGHNGTINGATWEGSSILGNYSLDFEESSDDHIVVTDHDDLSFGNGSEDRAFSLSAWIYRDADNDYGNIICKYDNVNKYREWIFYINGPSQRLIFTLHDEITDGYLSASAWEGSGTNLVSNTLYHVAATYDGSGSENGLAVWVNGINDTQMRSSANYVAMENMGEPVRIGKQGEQTTRSFDGIMDDVRIYDIELSTNDIEDIMNDDPSYGDPITTTTTPTTTTTTTTIESTTTIVESTTTAPSTTTTTPTIESTATIVEPTTIAPSTTTTTPTIESTTTIVEPTTIAPSTTTTRSAPVITPGFEIFPLIIGISIIIMLLKYVKKPKNR